MEPLLNFVLIAALSVWNAVSVESRDTTYNKFHLRRPLQKEGGEGSEARNALAETATDSIPEGQSVRCVGNDEDIFRWSNGGLHRYPDPTIASSWNKKWRDMITINCASMELSYGSPMKIFLDEGESVLCIGDETKVYRWQNGQLRHYPSPTAAASWKADWRDVVAIDCSRLSIGRPIDEKFFIKEGDNIMCHGDHQHVYRYTNGMLRHLPDPQIASSWNEHWRDHVQSVDCSPFEIVKPLFPKPEFFDIPVIAPFRVGRNSYYPDEIDLVVTKNTDAYAPPGQVKLVLSTEEHITWWKGVYCGAIGGWEMLGTVGDRHGPTSAYFTPEILQDAVLCKSQEFGTHKCLYELVLEGIERDLDPEYVYHFRWVSDN